MDSNSRTVDHESTCDSEASTLIDTAISAINAQIASRTLMPGSRLPSIRKFAESRGVSKSTIVEAYERLRADGTIESRPGAGFYVSAPLAPLSLAKSGPFLDREIDPLWVSRQSLEAPDDLLKPGCGWLPAAWMPEDGLRRVLRKLARGPRPAITNYAPAAGLAPLRELLSRRLVGGGVDASPEQILITETGTQAIDLLCRCLLQPGDTVLVDDPCYFNFHALLKAHNSNVVSVPYTPNGPDLALFEKVLKKDRPCLYITNSGIHNPTGATLSTGTAHRLLKLAEQHNLRIIEDDIFADLEDEPAVRLSALDDLDRVCHIGSFSMTISASVRCGFIAAPFDWVEELLDMRIATSFGTSNLAAEITLAMLKDTGYRKHLVSLRNRLANKRSHVSKQLALMRIEPWIEPRSGLFLWCQLPKEIDSIALAREALANKLVLAPGNAFSVSHKFSNFMRFNVAQTHDKRVYEVLKKAIENLR